MTMATTINVKKDFYTEVSKNANDVGFVSKYIYSGVANGRNLDGALTKDIFKKFFYVEVNPNIQKKYNEKINQLFEDQQHGVLGIQAHGGSGKTTTIEMIETILPKPCDLEKIPIIFLGTDIGYSGAIYRINKICKNKYGNKSQANPENENRISNSAFYDAVSKNIKKVKNILEYLSETDSNYEGLLSIWGIIAQGNLGDLIAENGIKYELLKNEKNIDTEKGIGLNAALLLLFVLIISDIACSKENDNKKILVVFDDIECVASSPIGNIIVESWSFLKSVFRCNEALYNGFNKIKTVVCARTTTGLIATQNGVGAWGNNDEYIIDIENNDFYAEALLKKLKYLHDHDLKSSILYRNTKLICQLICGVNNTDKYLGNKIQENNDSPDITEFAKKYYAPFFGNDYRQLAACICGCILDSGNSLAVKKLEDLIKQSVSAKHEDLYRVSINGARNILWRLIFKYLVGNPEISETHIFEYFGIQSIQGNKEDHSLTRILLSYLYWHNIRYLANNNWDASNYDGIPIEQLTSDVLNYFYDSEKIAKSIYKLSNLCAIKDGNKQKKLNQYTYYININNHSIANDLSNGNLSNHEKFVGVKLKLSPAGVCYVHHVSSHFEFFSARDTELTANPLIMYEHVDDRCIQVINNIYTRVLNYVKGMINNCAEGCKLYRQIHHNECSFNLSSNERFNLSHIFKCNLFVRVLEVNATIVSIIDYIDRYRQYLLLTEKNPLIRKTENEKLLNEIKNFAGLFTTTQKLIKSSRSFPNNFYNFIQYKIYPKYRNDSKQMESLGLYQTFSNSRLLYYTGNKKDLIFEAIEKELNELSGKTLFEICESIAKSI